MFLSLTLYLLLSLSLCYSVPLSVPCVLQQ